jgi:hypothetical protein
MRRSLAVVLVLVPAAMLAACGGDSPPVPKTITLTPSALAFDAVGAKATLTAAVADERGRAFDNATVTWSISGTGAELTPPPDGSTGVASHSATLETTAEGEVLVTATAGSATATLHVVIDQVPVSIVKVSGDDQIGAPNARLAQPITVRVLDRLLAPITDHAVTFQVVDGGGSVSSALAQPGADGMAGVTWTLGTEATEHVSATVAGASLTPATFTATAVEGGVTGLVVVQGGNEAVFAGAGATPPAVKAVNGAGVGVPGVTVSFSVTAGGGTINAASAVTDGSGVASLAKWTMGPIGALNSVTATVPVGTPLVINDAGCDAAGATGFGIALCYRTTMTDAQRQAFVSAAAKWSSIITGDLPDVPAASYAGACGGSVPTYEGPIDDLLIFATVEPIDGPFQIVGSAGPCTARSATLLPMIGSMRFDVADMNTLESRGLLNAVILHEMGHVLGIGTLWSRKGLVQDPSTTTAALDTYYSGANGLAGFDAIGGTTYTGGNKVPVANVGGSGTINGHWRESVLRKELLTGTIDDGSNPLSVLTVRSLQDLGYTVNVLNADPFFLTLSAQLPGAASVGGVSLEHDILTFPLMTVDAKGRPTPRPR